MFADIAQKIWDKMVDLQRRKDRVYNMTHDGKNDSSMHMFHIYKVDILIVLSSVPIGYLKLWQLTRPELGGYDVIFIDEAQDCTPGTENTLVVFLI